MKKILNFLWNNPLYVCTLFLLIFIPLYPKLPLVDIKNTWVYIRAEDFAVIVVLALWLFLLFKRKITFKTPLTLPIIIFWVIGAISTIHGVILIFPQAPNVFPNVAFLAFLRHIEYMSLFFIAFSCLKDRKLLPGVITVLSITFILIVLYGLGQKYLGFPAYLTMNEEFAKGTPIRLSQLSRVPSTFAGHYDLAAYLVLTIPILASLIFGVRNWFLRAFFIVAVVLGFGLLLLTVSRISFLVLFIALLIVLFLHNKKIVFLSIPVILVAGFLFAGSQPALFSRFGNTVKEVSVLVDAKTGTAVGHIDYKPLKNFENKFVSQRKIGDNGQIYTEPIDENNTSRASPSSILSLDRLPAQVPVVSDVNLSTGENLPSGTGYINLPLSPVIRKLKYFFYEKSKDEGVNESSQVFVFHGDFLVKRASAYDLSFTTRFQGEWPNAILAFNRNILIGSGYGSVSLAVDNNYLRMLGEVGLLGISSFFIIFISLGIYIKKLLPDIKSKIERSFIVGFIGGLIGLFLNAIFIDVFEASKVAFSLWILTGIVLGLLIAQRVDKIDLLKELKGVLTSTTAIIVYLFIVAFFIFSSSLNNFFVADDFTWFRWATDCSSRANNCLSIDTVVNYFTQADGFFYRPATKVYFLLMHSVFWLNQVAYHAVSILLHFIVVILFFLLAKKILRDLPLAVIASFLFLLMSGYSEAIFWISSTGYLFNAVFILLALLFFTLWDEKKKVIFFILSLSSMLLALFFHELGIVAPVLIILYKFIKEENFSFKSLKQYQYLFLLIPNLVYLILRFFASSHWFSGDYSYNLLKLPFNIVGNILGYITLVILGPVALSPYQGIRLFLRENVVIAAVLTVVIIILGVILRRKVFGLLGKSERKVVAFGFLFFVISLAPFLGLGNMTSRYSYLASLGILLIIALFIKKSYSYLQSYGKEISALTVTLLLAVFFLWHIIAVQQIHLDWAGAGEKSKRFFTSVDALYSDYWSKEQVELHFVNIPIRYGEAWVFPVGLSDAIWFAFENKNIKVFTHGSLEEAFRQAEDSYLRPVFIFKDDGSLEEASRPQSPATFDNTNKIN